MGTSTSAAEFSGKIRKAGANIKAAQRPAIEKEALAAKKYMQTAARMGAGPDMRLSGLKNRKLDVGYKIHGTDAIVFARGPWGLVDEGAAPHIISSKRGGGSRRSRASRLSEYGPSIGRGRIRGAINIPGIGWKAYARHPGTKGKHTWERRTRMLRTVVGKQYIKTVTNAADKAF